MKINTGSVSDSIQLTSVQTDKFKAGVLTIHLFSDVNASNVAHATVLCGVLKQGNKSFPSLSGVYRRLDELYAASLDVRTSFNASELSISLSSELLDNAYAPCGTDILDGVIELCAQTLLHPITDGDAFCEATVARETETVRSALLAEKNNTQTYAVIRAKEMLNRTAKNYPTVEELTSALDTVTPQSLYAFYKNILSYAPLDVFYVGGCDADTVAKKLLHHFDGFAPSRRFDLSLPAPAPALPFEEQTEQMSVSQSKLVLGFHSGVSLSVGGYHNALVFNEIFGSSPISKLFMNVRERLGLCYYCSSSYNTFSGALIVSSGIYASKREEATAAILDQLNAIKCGKVSETELEAAKRSLINAYRQCYDNPFDINNFYSSRIRLGMDETIEDCIEALGNVTLDKVVEVAASVVHDTTFFIEGDGISAEEVYDE